MAKINLVPTRFVHQVWPQVEDFLASAMEYSQGDITLDQLRADLGVNRKALYIAIEENKTIGAMVVSFENRYNQRVAFVFAIGGTWVVTKEHWDQAKKLLKAEGATHVEGVGRASASRLYCKELGFQQKYIVFGAEL